MGGVSRMLSEHLDHLLIQNIIEHEHHHANQTVRESLESIPRILRWRHHRATSTWESATYAWMKRVRRHARHAVVSAHSFTPTVNCDSCEKIIVKACIAQYASDHLQTWESDQKDVCG
jgi:hypothetical protein